MAAGFRIDPSQTFPRILLRIDLATFYFEECKSCYLKLQMMRVQKDLYYNLLLLVYLYSFRGIINLGNITLRE